MHQKRINYTDVCAGGACATSTSTHLPRELNKVSLPEYRIEPPDVLLIEAVNNLRPANAPLVTSDTLVIRVAKTVPIDPLDDEISVQFKKINGLYQIETDGSINLGPQYGSVVISGLNLRRAKLAIEQQLRLVLRDPQVSITLQASQSKQHVAGEHLVRPDGTVSLGIYGSVYLAGQSLTEAKSTLERHLCKSIHDPEVSVDVLAYNSKAYYVITDGGGAGEQVFRLPCTGNETVLDAIAQINGLPAVASKKDIWIARPAPPEAGHDQILPVRWDDIARGGATQTNYQILPGDRVYVQADDLVTFDTFVSKVTAPFERVLGFVLLGNSTVRVLQQGRQAFSQGGAGF